jgi:hypothetical protein
MSDRNARSERTVTFTLGSAVWKIDFPFQSLTSTGSLNLRNSEAGVARKFALIKTCRETSL